MQKKTFKILDMHCTNCPMILEGIEDDLPGIQQIAASYAKGNMVVEFDERLVSLDQIMAAIKKKGYQAKLM